VAEGYDLRFELARVRRLDRIAARRAVTLGHMTGARYQHKPVSSIATRCTAFPIGTGVKSEGAYEPWP
jgi:hypothetical protein